MSAAKEAREGALFVIASLAAGVGHYAFQILASRHLSADEFARFSGWLAHLSLAFVGAGLVQYAANFHPAPARLVRRSLTAVNVGMAAALLAWAFGGDALGPAPALAIVVLAIGYGWVTGQVQIRLDFRGLAFAQVLTAAVKVLIPVAVFGGLSGYAFGLGFGFVPATWLLSARLWSRTAAPSGLVARPSWTAPILIAVASNLIPQFDLLLMQHTQAPSTFDAFARVSLFYKGIYFVVFIFAQWLLPRQIRGGGPRWLGPGLVAGFAALSSVGLAVLSPLLVRYVFHWDQTPPRLLILMSCGHMSLLTLVFIQIQALSAAGRVKPAAAMLGVLGLEAALQLSFAWPTLTYLAAAIVAQSALVILALRVPSRAPA